tara:strand:+ start:12809 stop:13543 length:735 start_codon:yes stop_codon:yes gene_type:complete
MSNFTDFFAAGGAGGGLGQTITVGDISYPNARLISEMSLYQIYNSADGSYNSWSFGMFDVNEPDWYYNTGSGGNSDFVTVANITSSSNGGALYGAFCYFDHSSHDHSARVVSMRITIDGTATTKTSNSRDSFNWNMVYLGPIGAVNITHVGDTGDGRYTTDGFLQAPVGDKGQPEVFWYHNSTGTYNANGDNGDTRQKVFAKTQSPQFGPYPLPYIYFANTCKVEMKVNRDNSQDRMWAGIRLF